jgi:hypothetical protein
MLMCVAFIESTAQFVSSTIPSASGVYRLQVLERNVGSNKTKVNWKQTLPYKWLRFTFMHLHRLVRAAKQIVFTCHLQPTQMAWLDFLKYNRVDEIRRKWTRPF